MIKGHESMRILQLHCDNISYEPTKKEIQSAEEIDPKPVSIDEVVVCFVAVEKDDTEDIAKMRYHKSRNQ